MVRVVLILLFCCTLASAANNFSGESACVAVWRLEDGALTTDTMSLNTLSNTGVTADTTTKAEGGASGLFDGSDRMSITDSGLSSGFPLKSGGSERNMSVCAWVRVDDLPGEGTTQALWTKWYDGTPNKWSIAMTVTTSSGTSIFRLVVGKTSGTEAVLLACTGLSVSADAWYHVGFTYNNSTKAWAVRIWNGSSATDWSGTLSEVISVTTAAWVLGAIENATLPLDGLLDEVVVMKRVLTSGEIDQIRAGTFGATAGSRRRIIVIQ